MKSVDEVSYRFSVSGFLFARPQCGKCILRKENTFGRPKTVIQRWIKSETCSGHVLMLIELIQTLTYVPQQNLADAYPRLTSIVGLLVRAFVTQPLPHDNVLKSYILTHIANKGFVLLIWEKYAKQRLAKHMNFQMSEIVREDTDHVNRLNRGTSSLHYSRGARIPSGQLLGSRILARLNGLLMW